MNIPRDKWHEALGSRVIGPDGRLFQIVGFIDRPAVIMRPVDAEGCQTVEIMGSETSKQYRRLAPID